MNGSGISSAIVHIIQLAWNIMVLNELGKSITRAFSSLLSNETAIDEKVCEMEPHSYAIAFGRPTKGNLQGPPGGRCECSLGADLEEERKRPGQHQRTAFGR